MAATGIGQTGSEVARKAFTRPQDKLHVVPPTDLAPARRLSLTANGGTGSVAGHAGVTTSGADTGDVAPAPLYLAAIQDLLHTHRLDAAAKLALGTLDRRAADGEEAAAAIAAVLRAYQGQAAALPPLSCVLPRPISPDDRAVRAFAQICSLLALQNAQLDELKATIAELI